MAGVRFPAGRGIFLSVATSRPALWPTQPHVYWAAGAKRTGREAENLSLSNAEVKNARSCISAPPYLMA